MVRLCREPCYGLPRTPLTEPSLFRTRLLRTGLVGRAITEPRDSVPFPCDLGPENGELPRAARQSVVVDMTIRHPMLLTASIWSTVPPGLPPPASRRLRDWPVSGEVQGTPVRISYLLRELVVTIR
jgi:hypothetical protein